MKLKTTSAPNGQKKGFWKRVENFFYKIALKHQMRGATLTLKGYYFNQYLAQLVQAYDEEKEFTDFIEDYEGLIQIYIEDLGYEREVIVRILHWWFSELIRENKFQPD